MNRYYIKKNISLLLALILVFGMFPESAIASEEPAATSAETVDVPAETGPVEPAAESVEPAPEPAGPAAGPVEPAAEPVEPAAEPVEPAAEPHVHIWDAGTPVLNATCTEAGTIMYTCTGCGETMSDVLPAAGHAWSEWTVTAEPTCTEAGSRQQVCAVCGETNIEEIPAAGHTPGDWTITKEPTCEKTGSREQTCTVCGEIVTEEIPASGHDWGGWKVTKEPTCKEEGQREHVCKTCRKKEKEKIEKKEHRWSGDNLYCQDCKILKIIAEGGKYDFELDGEHWVIAGNAAADAEGAGTWDAMFADFPYTDIWAEDLIEVAKSQIGYAESIANFAISDKLRRKGYSRYGAWYGAPYGDWCAMFVSFCLHYANIPSSEMPYQASCPIWISTLKAKEMFASADSYIPRPGDLIFYDYQGDGVSDHVGIVEYVDEENEVIHTIEGNYNDVVCTREISIHDSSIMGFGILPENPEKREKTEETGGIETEETESTGITKKLRMAADSGTKAGETKDVTPTTPAGTAILEFADLYYTLNEDGTQATGVNQYGPYDEETDSYLGTKTYISISGGPSDPEQVKAGETLKYRITYGTVVADYMKPEGYDADMKLYDSYYDNKVIVRLPKGLIMAGSENGSFSLITDTTDPNYNADYNTYVLPVVSPPSTTGVPSDSKEYWTDISVFVQNNGTDHALATYDLTDMAYFEVHFDLLDKTDKHHPAYLGTRSQSSKASAPTVKTVTPDEWHVEKTPTKASVSGSTVTFEWTVDAGFLDTDGKIDKEDSHYSRTGRDAVTAASLKDTFTTALSDGTNMTGKEGTITIAKVGSTAAPSTFASGTPIPLTGDLAMNTKANVDADGATGNEQAVPTWTQYTVKVTYPVTEADPDMIAEFYENKKTITQNNKADLSVTLAGITDPQTDSDQDTQTTDLPVTQPASIHISKDLRERGDSGHQAYNNNYGAIPYTLSADVPFDIYTAPAGTGAPYTVAQSAVRDAADGKYKISFEAASTYDVIVKSGIAYTVTENMTDAQLKKMAYVTRTVSGTPEEGKTWNAEVVNRKIYGSVSLEKKDDNGNAVKDAYFTLKNNAGYTSTKQTDGSGKISWTPLEYGSYTITETKADGTAGVPTGYSIGTITPSSFTIDDAHQDIKVSATNIKTEATLRLSKYKGVAEANIKDDSHLAKDFTNTYTLQSTTTPNDPNSWRDVEGYKNMTLTNGRIVVNVPAKTNDTPVKVIYYRFHESAIPNGYYDPVSGSTTEAFSQETNLMDPQDQSKISDKVTDVDIQNRRCIDIQARKSFYDINGEGSAEIIDKTTSVQLYSYAGDKPADSSGLHPEGTKTFGRQNGEDTIAEWKDLPAYKDDNKKVHYLIKESEISGYVLGEFTNDGSTSTVTKETIGGVTYLEIGIPATKTDLVFKALLKNYQNVIPVRITKRNYYTNEQNLSEFRFSVYTDEGKTTYAKDAKTGAELKEVPFNVDSKGILCYLTPGTDKIYYFDEVFDQTHPLPSGWRFVECSDDGKIDLTRYSQPEASSGSTKILERYIYNKQYPNIRINKKDWNTGNAIAASQFPNGTEFGVYTKSGSTYTLVATITSINANSGILLPPGTYYVAEKKVPTGYLNPNSANAAALYNSMYSDSDPYTYDSGTRLTYREIKVEDMAHPSKPGAGTPNAAAFDFYNIPNKGSLKVIKYVDGSASSVLGFPITVTYMENGVQKTKEEPSGASGVTTFSDLPVYNSDGSKISYVVTEELSGTAFDAKYYKVFDGQTAQLILNVSDKKVVTQDKDINGNQLKVENKTKIDLQITKWRIDTWQAAAGGMIPFQLPGAEIGLYVQQADSSWKLTEIKTTDAGGLVEFTRLDREHNYALVELSSPNTALFPYDMNYSGDERWKDFPESKEIGSAIGDSDLYRYNVRTITSAYIAAHPASSYNLDELEKGALYNANHWVQFHVTKWRDGTSSRSLTPEEFEPYLEGYKWPAYPGGKPKDGPEGFSRIDNSVFSLYRLKIEDTTESVEFTRNTPWKLVGSYSSGTAYAPDGSRIHGDFFTGVEKNIDKNYVYVLVEEHQGPTSGAVINNYFRYTFWYCSTHDAVTCTVPDFSYPVRRLEYEIDHVNHEDVLNDTTTGPVGEIYVASLRLSKWSDSYDKDGNRNKKYEPLSNAKFELRLPDGTVVSEMTSGKEALENYALAQSGAFSLLITTAEDGTPKYTMVEYEHEKEPWGADVTPYVDVIDDGGYRIYAVRMDLYETEAPEGYGYLREPYETWLCFVDPTPGSTVDGQSTWYFNDLYFVKTKDPNVKLAEDQNERLYYLTDVYDQSAEPISNSSDGQLRIVDYPVKNTPVTVYKFGYAPSDETICKSTDTVKKDSAWLYENVDVTMLGGVTMVLKRMHDDPNAENYGKFSEWNATTDDWGSGTFVTKGSGSYMFPQGLPMGTYLIYETELGAYSETYEKAYYDEAHARVFKVGGEASDIFMANPEMIDLKLIKKNMAGDPLKDASFTLKGKDLENKDVSRTDKTGTDGSVVFENFPTGTYKLSEQVSGYTDQYLAKYLETIDADLAKLVGTGAFLGYGYENREFAEDTSVSTDKDTVITSVSNAAMLRTAATAEGKEYYTLELTIKNPKLSSFSLHKKAEGSGNNISGAAFSAYYHDAFKGVDAFGNTPASVTVSAFDPDNIDTNYWKTFTGSSQTTGSDGTISWSGLQPGMYAVYETGAPAGDDTATGYEMPKTSDGKAVVYYVVVTGGLNASVSGLPSTVTVKYADGSEKPDVPVLWIHNGTGTAVKVEAENREKVKLEALKKVNYGEFAPEGRNWSVTLDVYSDSAARVKAGTVTITKNSDTEPAKTTFKTPDKSKDAWFDQNTTYYIKETSVTPDYVTFTGFTVNGTPLAEAGTNTGIYSFKTGKYDQDPVVIQADNDWRRAQVNFRKFDANDTDRQYPLSGAEFDKAEYKNAQGQWVDMGRPGTNWNWTELLDGGAGTGVYQVDLPLLYADATYFRIYETKAPNGDYQDPRGNIVLDLEALNQPVSMTDNIKDLTVDLYLTNSKGNELKITKYNNIHSSSAAEPVGRDKAEFTIYHYLNDSQEWEIVHKKATDGTGTVSYITVPGDVYAVAETDHSQEYIGLDGFYLNDVKLTNYHDDLPLADGGTAAAYVLSESTGKVELKAYNIPRITPVIAKEDVGGYPENVRATMQYCIYDVTDVAAFADTGKVDDTVVERYLEKKPTAVFEGKTGEGTDSDYGSSGTKGSWSSGEDGRSWNPTRKYLLVEESVSARGGKKYDTIDKDDSRVKWFEVIDPVNNPNPAEAPVYVLKNICGDVTNAVTKTVDKEEIASLLLADDKGVDLTYTITPAVTTVNQPLESYVVTDAVLTDGEPAVIQPGLTFCDKNGAAVTHKYTITGITVGAASYDENAAQTFDSKFGTISDFTISAEVKFYDASGNEIAGSQYAISDISADKEVPADKIPGNAVSFEVRYFTEEIESKTGGIYTLGYGFEVKNATVFTAKIAKLEDSGDSTKPVVEIAKIRNTVNTLATYPKWNNDIFDSKKEMISVPAADTAETTVGHTLLPEISVEKTSDPNLTIQPGTDSHPSYVQYFITITNKGDPAVNFKDPLVLDILPTGVTFYQDEHHKVEVGEPTIGEKLALSGDPAVIVGESTLEFTNESGEVEYGPSETAVIFRLSGELEPTAEMTLSFYAKVSENVPLYGDEIENDVFLSSSAHSFHTVDNRHGYPYQVDDGEYANTLPVEAEALDKITKTGFAVRKLGGLASKLGAYVGDHADDYVWMSHYKSVQVNADASITLRKAVQGDRDPAFSDLDTFLGSATRSNFESPETAVPCKTPGVDESEWDQGWVNWRLSVYNGDPSETHANLAVGDVISMRGDPRSSVWDTVMDAVSGAMIGTNPVKTSDYTVYYYTGGIKTAATQVRLALAKDATGKPACFSWGDTPPAERDWHLAGSITSYYGKDGSPGLTDVTAFVIAFDPTVTLAPEESMVIIYHTTVANMPDDDEFYGTADIEGFAFENAKNNFYVNSVQLTQPMLSNTVSVTIQDKPVSVEGDLWIDEDWDGMQEPGGNRRDYSQYKIVTDLADAISFSIKDNRSGGGTNDDDKGSTVADHGFAESVKHFRFEGLGAGKAVRTPLYDENNENILIPSALKGDDPYNYTLFAQLDSDKISYLLNIFELTERGRTHYMSDNPDTATANDDNVRDDNFYRYVLNRGDVQDTGSYQTFPFYIRYSEKVDQSKDIGYRGYRDLEITKAAEDDPEITLEGVKFKIFGPYDDEESTLQNKHMVDQYDGVNDLLTFDETVDEESGKTVYVYNAEGKGAVKELETDEDGKVRVTGLNWWKEYVIKETETLPGYTIDMDSIAEAADGSGTVIDHPDADNFGPGEWVLRIPVKTRTTRPDIVLVKNPRKVNVQLQVEKFFESFTDREFTFTFDLTLDSVRKLDGETPQDPKLNKVLLEADPIDTASITIKGDESGESKAFKQFRVLELNGEGIYHFIITERNPAIHGVQYEDGRAESLQKTADVTVQWNTEKQKLEVTSIVYGDPVAEGEAPDQEYYEKFTNSYTPEPVWWHPRAKKLMTGEPTVEDKDFVFSLTAAEGNPRGGAVLPDDTTVTVTVPSGEKESPVGAFGDIRFTRDGTYTFTAAETPDTAGEPPVMTYDKNTVVFTVKIRDDSGRLAVEDVTFNGDAERDETDKLIVTAKFTNEYTPTPVDWSPKAKKRMTGEPTVKDKEFTFTLTADEENPEGGASLDAEGGPDTITVTVPAGKTESPVKPFADITFSKAGIYMFTAAETPDTAGEPPVMTYDKNTVMFTVEIEDTGGALAVRDVTFEGDAEKEKDEEGNIVITAIFTNKYTPTPAKLQIPVEKTLAGRKPQKEMTFDFTLTAVDGAPMPEGSGNKASITITPEEYENVEALFGEITYTSAGIYSYEIKEEAGRISGVTYDPGICKVTVTVVDDPEGTLTVESCAFRKDLKDADRALFINTYKPTPAEIPLGVRKIMNGRLPEDVSYSFAFDLTSEDTKAPLPEKTHVSVTVPGSPASGFGTIRYEEAGTYTYTVQEVKGSSRAVSYDTAPKTVTVIVTDEDGVLIAKVKGAQKAGSGDVYEVEITNEYRSGSLRIRKTVAGTGGDTKKVFPFKIMLDAEGSYPYKIFNAQGTEIGKGSIKSGGTVGLAHDQYALIENLPAGAKYTVTETDSAGHTVTSTGEAGKIEADKIVQASFINTRPATPPGPPGVPKTGESNLLFMSILAMIFSAAGMILTWLFGRKRRRQEKR